MVAFVYGLILVYTFKIGNLNFKNTKFSSDLLFVSKICFTFVNRIKNG